MESKEPINNDLEDPDEEEMSEEEEEQIDPKVFLRLTLQQLEAPFIEACKTGNYESAQQLLGKQVDVMCEDDRKWTPLMWAANRGHIDIVRLLIKAGACEVSTSNLQQTSQLPSGQAADDMEGIDYINQAPPDPFKKPLNAALMGRYTPLHWASYKGYHQIVWMLLQAGMSPHDIDMHGNNAVHHAAAGGNIPVMECFLSMGFDIGVKNARGHSPLDLATTDEMINLIKRATETKQCAATGQKFDFQNTPFLCLFDKKFYCNDAIKRFWTWETSESLDKERPVTYSLENYAKIESAADDLRQLMDEAEYYNLDTKLKDIEKNKFDIDPKLKFQAQELHRKLFAELDIRNFIKSLAYVENFKTIKKSVQILNDKVEKAKHEGIELNPSVLAEVNKTSSRLLAQRNLRFQVNKCKVSAAEPNQVELLDDLITKASENSVSSEYTKQAETLSSRMSGNIKAHNILQLFLDYPEREYPEEEVVDPRAKGGKDAKKDAGKKTPMKKKRKKEPPFIYPEWAQDLTAVISEVQNMEHLVHNSEDLNLDEEFVKQVQEQIGRFKKEIAYRKKLEEEERIAAELKKQKKAAKGK